MIVQGIRINSNQSQKRKISVSFTKNPTELINTWNCGIKRKIIKDSKKFSDLLNYFEKLDSAKFKKSVEPYGAEKLITTECYLNAPEKNLEIPDELKNDKEFIKKLNFLQKPTKHDESITNGEYLVNLLNKIDGTTPEAKKENSFVVFKYPVGKTKEKVKN